MAEDDNVVADDAAETAEMAHMANVAASVAAFHGYEFLPRGDERLLHQVGTVQWDNPQCHNYR